MSKVDVGVAVLDGRLLKAPEFELLARGKVDMKGKGLLPTFWLRMPDEVERQLDGNVQPQVTIRVA